MRPGGGPCTAWVPATNRSCWNCLVHCLPAWQHSASHAPTSQPGSALDTCCVRRTHPGCTRACAPRRYYGGQRGFDLVLDLLDDACQGLLAAIRQRQGKA